MNIFRSLLVRNEQDIIKQNLEFHKDKADGLIVTDNMSTDGTREILEDYMRAGIIDLIIDEKEQNYNQYLWTTRMTNIAKEVYNADYVYSTDADEFWDIPNLDLFKRALGFFKLTNVFKCEYFNMLPEDNVDFLNFKYKIMNKPFESEQLSKAYNLFSYIIDNPDNKYKALYSTEGFIKNWQGNHSVDIQDKEELITHIDILHYPVRSYEQFLDKIIQGGQAYERNTELPSGMGSHWKSLYSIYKEGNFESEYNKIIGKNLDLTELIQNGIIEEVESLRDL